MSLSFGRFDVHPSLYPISVCDVVAAGEIDISNADDLRQEIAWNVETSKFHSVLVDMSTVTFLGAAGINALVAASEHAHSQEHKLVLVNVSPGLRRLFQLVDVDKQLSLRSFAE